MNRSLAAFALLAASILPASAEPFREGERVCMWGKRGTVEIGSMPSGRPGFDAVYVAFDKGGEAFVLVPQGKRPDCRKAPIY